VTERQTVRIGLCGKFRRATPSRDIRDIAQWAKEELRTGEVKYKL